LVSKNTLASKFLFAGRPQAQKAFLKIDQYSQALRSFAFKISRDPDTLIE